MNKTMSFYLLLTVSMLFNSTSFAMEESSSDSETEKKGLHDDNILKSLEKILEVCDESVRGLLADVCPGNWDWKGDTPLHCLSFCGEHPQLLLSLLQHGASPNVLDGGGSTALHQATFTDNSEMIKYLLAYKADPNVQDNDGQTPLHKAVNRDSDAVGSVLPLILAGANPCVRDKDQKTPLSLARLHFALLSEVEEYCTNASNVLKILIVKKEALKRGLGPNATAYLVSLAVEK